METGWGCRAGQADSAAENESGEQATEENKEGKGIGGSEESHEEVVTRPAA